MRGPRHSASQWILAASLLVGWAFPVSANPIHFSTLLTSDQEATDTGSPAAGSALLTYDPDTQLMSVNALVVGIERSDLIDVGGAGPFHLHSGLPGMSGPILVGLGAIGDWQDVVIGGIALGISLSAIDIDLTGMLTGQEIADLESLLLQSDGSKTYLNLHTADFPNGEIRGDIPAVPEPGTAALLAIGLAELGRRAGRRRTPLVHTRG
jgi:CHRD domain